MKLLQISEESLNIQKTSQSISKIVPAQQTSVIALKI
ncbi:uncharacterized protein METZ01_LOCUS382970 [marine metagenome]|uniref:Uncharacterized protein n=1 Tax=marine metagenome TaxID=408172 RepID=A0A382U726_9ZZZZ